MSGNGNMRVRDINVSETWMAAALVKIARIPGLEPLLDMTVMEAWDWLANTLNEREARVFACRFGIHDGRQRNLEDTGHELGITRERVRQIEAKALAKMRDRLDEQKGGTAG